MGSTFYSKRYHPETGRFRKRRPKSFKSIDQARAYAKKAGREKITLRKLNYVSKKLVLSPDSAGLPVSKDKA
jgi:hypothetical protein